MERLPAATQFAGNEGYGTPIAMANSTSTLRFNGDEGYGTPMANLPHINSDEGSGPPTPVANSSMLTAHDQSAVIPPLVVDRMAKDLGLDDSFRSNLHAFVQLGSRNGALSQADLGTRAYMLATIYQDMTERRRHEQANPANTLTKLLNDLQIRLDDSFTLTKEQADNIRIVAQDLIYQPTCTAFKSLHIDVARQVQERKTEMKFTNIFGNPAREKVLHVKIKRICSSVRNAMRQDLRDSIIGEKKCSLEDFTMATAPKYKRFGIGEAISKADMIHNVLLRAIAYEHRAILAVEDGEASDDEAENRTPAPAPKKRKRGGRVAKGEDFWSLVDAYFIKQVEANGRLMKTPQWKEIIDRLVVQDKRLFDTDFLRTQSISMASSPIAQTVPQAGFSLSQEEGGPPASYRGPAGLLSMMNPQARQ
ncbi:hypothetical protein EYR40_001785 [Pleurotus pulmonarius]|nr:hypothetical protein EYR40_001785 [Pleurotus pulmonarius]